MSKRRIVVVNSVPNYSIQPEVNEDVILSAISEGSSDAITRIDSEGVILSWTPGAERMLGYSKKEMIGRQVYEIIPEDMRDQARETIRDQMLGQVGVLHEETRRLSKDGKSVPVFLTRVPLKNPQGQIVSLLAILKDISEEKKLQEQVQRLQRDTAMAKVAAKVAHEIRTPLGVLFLKSDLLVERFDTAFDDWGKGDGAEHKNKVNKCVNDIQKQISRLEEIATNYLHLSKSRAMERQQVNITEVLRDLHKELKEQFSHTAITIHLDTREGLPLVEGDPQQLARVAANLVRNSVEAIQYSQNKTGDVYLRSLAEGENAVIEVSDNGPGMSQEIQDNIFDPFITTKSIGTGLGLYLVREIVQNHGGEIVIQSKEGEGASVRVVLPPKQEATE